MTKSEMAQRFAEILLDSGLRGDFDLDKDWYKGIASDAWQLADAMQAEADKREQSEAKEKREKVRALLNDNGTFIEREGQHFDDVANLCKTYTNSNDWQPDWSKAPGKSVAYTVDHDGFCAWHFEEPVILGYGWTNTIGLLEAPSFNYQGNWRDSLRKRP